MNGDGVLDYAIGAMQIAWRQPHRGGYVVALSGADHEVFFKSLGHTKSRFGYDMCAIGDVNEDGFADLAIGLPGHLPGRITAQGMNPYLTASANAIQASSTEPVHLQITFPAAEAWRPYRILVSHSGLGPTTINGFEIPLGWDPLLQAGLDGQTPPFSAGFAGQLDERGRADAQVTGAPYLARWPGARLYLAAITFETFGSVCIGRLTSIPLTLNIDP